MRLLFDQGTPVPLRQHLFGHVVATAHELGWGQLKNGELLAQAEQRGFEVLVTTDQNLKYQQHLDTRRIAIVVLGITSWPRLQKVIPSIVEALSLIKAGDYVDILVPHDR